MRGVGTMYENKQKNNNEVMQKYIIKRRYTNEITPIQAILPIVLDDIKRRREEYMKAHPEEFKKI